MTREEYLVYHRAACDKMVEITTKKNADYTNGSADPFFNFTRVEAVGIADTETGFLTRMFDKFARITTFVRKGSLEVADETVEDTLLDLANYCVLMAGYLKAKRAGHGVPEWTTSAPHRKTDPGERSEPVARSASGGLTDAVRRSARRSKATSPC